MVIQYTYTFIILQNASTVKWGSVIIHSWPGYVHFKYAIKRPLHSVGINIFEGVSISILSVIKSSMVGVEYLTYLVFIFQKCMCFDKLFELPRSGDCIDRSQLRFPMRN